MHAAYDEIADWYENEFLATTAAGDPIGVRAGLEALLGRGTGACLEVGCGTGVHAAQLRDLGWEPLGVDLSTAMLAYAGNRLPIAQADATRLPVRDAALGAVVAVMVHTDGVRARVGASHLPLPALLQAFLDAGLRLTGFAEGGAPTPTTLSVRAVSS